MDNMRSWTASRGWDTLSAPPACFSVFATLPGISARVVCQCLGAEDENGSSSAVHVDHGVMRNEIMKSVASFIYIFIIIFASEGETVGTLGYF